MGAPPFYVFDQLYITFLIFFLSMSVKLKLSRAFNSPGRANLGRRQEKIRRNAVSTLYTSRRTKQKIFLACLLTQDKLAQTSTPD